LFAFIFRTICPIKSFSTTILRRIIHFFQWFNPIVFIIRKSMQEVHEFLADDGVLKRGFDPADYFDIN